MDHPNILAMESMKNNENTLECHHNFLIQQFFWGEFLHHCDNQRYKICYHKYSRIFFIFKRNYKNFKKIFNFRPMWDDQFQ